jgi:predicted alpha/beta-fold hydrolase
MAAESKSTVSHDVPRAFARAPWWLPGPHAQTMFPRLFRRVDLPATQRVRVATPDGDGISVERLRGFDSAPRVMLFHGLEGGLHSPYARALMAEAARRRWYADLVLWRTCDGIPVNAVARSYHSGASDDADTVIRHVVESDPGRPLYLVGVSLGGNVLLKWLGERGRLAAPEVRAAAAVSVPFDLAAAARHLERGTRRLYTRFFLRSLIAKALAKLDRVPGIANRDRVQRARTLREFDDAFTAPVHGFLDAGDYYSRSSAIGYLDGISAPTLLVSAANDPFLPWEVLARVKERAADNPNLTCLFPATGGHVGFVSGPFPWSPRYWLENFVLDWLHSASNTTVQRR